MGKVGIVFEQVIVALILVGAIIAALFNPLAYGTAGFLLAACIMLWHMAYNK